MQQIITPPAGGGPTCPTCQTNTIRVRLVLVAKPLGTFSLAGAQLKVSARTKAVAECTNATCDVSVPGEIVGAEMSNDGKKFTGGHFVADSIQATS